MNFKSGFSTPDTGDPRCEDIAQLAECLPSIRKVQVLSLAYHKIDYGAGKMAQHIKVLVSKPSNLSSIS